MAGALLISSGEKSNELLQNVLQEMRCGETMLCTNGAQSRRLFIEGDWDIVVVNAPLPDETGTELSVRAAEQTCAGVVLLVKAEHADEAASRVEDAGVFVVPKPLNRTLLYGAIKMALAARRRLLGLRAQNDKLTRRIEEIRLVDRAKCALIQYRQLTENEAHKYIEKEAMDARKSRGDVARRILEMLEDT